MSTYNLETRSKEFALVVNMPYTFNNDIDKFNHIVEVGLESYNSLGYLYFACLHDKDTNEGQTLKTLHYHIVLVSKNRKRLKTILLELCDLFGDFPIDCVSIAKVDNLALSVQYLIHKNDQTKYQYQYNDIITNSNDNLQTLFAVEKASIKVDEYMLFKLVDDGLTSAEIMFKIGLGNYNLYKKIIDMLIKERSNKWHWDKLSLIYSDGVIKNESH